MAIIEKGSEDPQNDGMFQKTATLRLRDRQLDELVSLLVEGDRLERDAKRKFLQAVALARHLAGVDPGLL